MIEVVLALALVSVPAPLEKTVFRQWPEEPCPCRETPEGRDYEICWTAEEPWNPYGVDHIAGHALSFGPEGPLDCFYLWSNTLIPASETENLFSEARAACALPWAEAQALSIYYHSSTTISQDGRFIIPHCYGMTELHVYEIVGLHFDYRHVRSIPVPAGVEAVRFFSNHLIVLDREKIVAYSMRPGLRFVKEAEFPFPHGVFHFYYANPDVQSPTWMRNMVMNGDYLYLLNSVGNDYGPLLTFKIGDRSIEMVHDGREFITEDDGYPFVFRNNLQLNEIYEKKYLEYHQDACQDQQWPGGSALYRLDDNIPVVVWPPGRSIGCFYWYRSFKNKFMSLDRSKEVDLLRLIQE